MGSKVLRDAVRQILEEEQELNERGISAGALGETIEQMLSLDYKERFKAEYRQTKIRYEKLKDLNNRIEAAEMTCSPAPKHDCPPYLLREQQKMMGEYLHILEVRAVIENVDLED